MEGRSLRTLVGQACRSSQWQRASTLRFCLSVHSSVCLFWHTYTCTHCPSLRCGCTEAGVFVKEITLHCFQFIPSCHPYSICRTATDWLTDWLDTGMVSYSPVDPIIGWSGSVRVLKCYATHTGNTYFWCVSVYVSRSIRTPHKNRDWSAALSLQQQ